MSDFIDFLVVVLPTVIALVSVQVSIKLTKGEEHKVWWWIIVILGVGTSGLTWISQSNARKAHEGEMSSLQTKLDQSLLTQQYTKGQLDSISVMVSKFGEGSGTPQALSEALKAIAMANAQKVQDLKASNKELCSRALDEAHKIRTFEQAYEKDERDSEMKEFQLMREATTEEQRKEIRNRTFAEIPQKYLAHDATFRSNYIGDAKYIKDLMLDRISSDKRRILLANNGQAESNLNSGMLAGAFNEYGIANYLEEMAKALCTK